MEQKYKNQQQLFLHFSPPITHERNKKTYFLAFNIFCCSWMIESFLPVSLPMSIMYSNPPSALVVPIRKQLSSLVAKVLPAESLMWAMLKLPGCFSEFINVPIRPQFRPLVTITVDPTTNDENFSIFLVSRLYTKVSLGLMSGSGYRIVLPSWVTRLYCCVCVCVCVMVQDVKIHQEREREKESLLSKWNVAHGRFR